MVFNNKKSALRNKIRKLTKSIEIFKLSKQLKMDKELNKFIDKLYVDFDKKSLELVGNSKEIEAKKAFAIAKIENKQHLKRLEANHTYKKAVEANEGDLDTALKVKDEKIAILDKEKAVKTKACIEKFEKLVVKGKFDVEKGEIELENIAKDIESEIENYKKSLQGKMDSEVEKYKSDIKEKTDKLERELNSHSSNSEKLKGEEVLKLDGLCMYFGGLKAVDDLNFSVNQGEIFGLIGPNGAGKTTVFNCITQFYNPTKGEVYYKNQQNEVMLLNDEKVHDVVNYGVVRTFQNVELVWELTVLENLLVASHSNYQSSLFDQMFNLPILKKEEQLQKAKAMEVLEYLGLTEYAMRIPYGLPYGILKRIELARTLMCNPKLIILDEPAAGLNDQETIELSKVIRKIRDQMNVTIFLVEHDMGLVMDICDRICAISFGKMLAVGTPTEIQQNKLVQEAYLGVEGED